MPVAITFSDLARGFDIVSHEILLNKLHNISIRGCAHDLLGNDSNDIIQCARIDNSTSEYCTVCTGVLQGSVLSPLFFILYIYNLLELVIVPVSKGNYPRFTISFADDTAVILTEETWTRVDDEMNS